MGSRVIQDDPSSAKTLVPIRSQPQGPGMWTWAEISGGTKLSTHQNDFVESPSLSFLFPFFVLDLL